MGVASIGHGMGTLETHPVDSFSVTDTSAKIMAEAAVNLRNSLMAAEKKPDLQWQRVGVEFGGTMAAGVSGTVFWAVASRSRMGLVTKVAGTALVSGSARVGAQTGLESALLPEKEHTPLREQFLWGVVDGFAGVAGAAAEARARQWYTKKLGFEYLGVGISQDLAATAGRKAYQGSLAAKFRVNAAGAFAGGATGGFVWGVPHELHNNRNNLHTAEGWQRVATGVGVDTAFGGVAGGVFSTVLTGATNARDLFGHTSAAITGEKGLTKVRLLHFNDMHSSMLGDESTLSQLAHKAKELRADASKKGISSLVFDAGDNFSGTPEAGVSQVGYVETRAITGHMQADGFVPGNHVADAGNAEVDVDGWFKAITRIRSELGIDIPGVAANIEVPKYPGFSGPNGTIYRPYRVLDIKSANGSTERVGLVGLVTEELASAAKVGDIKYLDAEREAKRWITHLNKPVAEGGEGINKVIVLSHLGRNEDVQLARNVPGISYIVSAHSHDAEPVILWARNAQSQWDVPILQAGSQAKWLAQTDLVFQPSGAADRYRTFGRLHRMDASVPHDPATRDFLLRELAPMVGLENHKVNATVTGTFHMDGVRGSHGGQTELGTLISRAVLDGVNRRMPQLNAARAQQGLAPLEPVHIMLKHTGEIREALPAGVPSKREIARMFLNTGSVERETRELAIVSLTGDELKSVLNFGIADFPQPLHLRQDSGWQKVTRTAREVFGQLPDEPFHDYPGNFLQTEGLRYSIDLSQPVGSRVSAIEAWDATRSAFVPIESQRTYQILTYNHPLEKWNKNKVFGQALHDGGEQAIRQHANAQSIPLSQVDLMIDWLEHNKVISPADYLSDNITNLTPPRWQADVRPRIAPLTGIGITDTSRERK